MTGEMVNKYTYDVFGKVLREAEGIPNPFKYVGRFGVLDEMNGLLYMRARYYDPEIGRFINKDRIMFGNNEVNLYAYVGNDPINKIDPGGESLKSWIEWIKKWSKPIGKIYDYYGWFKVLREAESVEEVMQKFFWERLEKIPQFKIPIVNKEVNVKYEVKEALKSLPDRFFSLGEWVNDLLSRCR